MSWRNKSVAHHSSTEEPLGAKVMNTSGIGLQCIVLRLHTSSDQSQLHVSSLCMKTMYLCFYLSWKTKPNQMLCNHSAGWGSFLLSFVCPGDC